MFEDIEIAIVAPFPSRKRVKEGWMSRIGTVDEIIKQRARLYIHISQNNSPEASFSKVEENAWEICISPGSPDYKGVLDSIYESVNTVYIHTIHLAEFIVPWLDSGKCIVDFHGIVPEEEVMLGRPELVGKYEAIEQEVLRKAKACVMVTRAMQKHYREKYPLINPKVIVLPIVEEMHFPANVGDPKGESELPVRVVYAGGIQVWQNVDAMLELAAVAHGVADFQFLSQDWKAIEKDAKNKPLPRKPKFKFCPKENLVQEYMNHDFGLVLRDDSAVNRVACPTKLYEYMEIGLIPIVRSPMLGDFLELGYAYVTENEFEAGFFPDRVSRGMMQKKNKQVVRAMREMFLAGASDLRSRLDA